ncbi:MAG TPA: ankyrin repeat domain-containing protein [Steroidobacteraceae bacterium]|nr:ankyrin repeat domain-containing protein [Steroidobacteraceae bacterium]
MFKLTIRASALAAALGALSLGAAASCFADGAPQTLIDLIRAHQRDAVLAAITSPDIDVNAADPDGSTPLMWATYTVDHELVRELLKKGAKAKVTNRYGSSPLGEAVKLGDSEMVSMLLDAGADANSPNQDGQTALMLASNIGSLPIAQLLIAHGANVNAIETFRGQNALMWAAAENHPDVVDLLLAHGANVKLRARYDDWPREMTSEPRAQFNQTGGLTALLYATRSGCYRCAVAIVKAGADVNQPNPDGITPLINALDSRDYDIAMFLLDKGANASAWDMTGRTPLYVAVDMNSYRGRGIGGPTGFAGYAGPTAAHPRSKATAMDVVNRLLAMGVDPNHELTRMRPNGNGRGRFEDYMMRGGTGAVMIASMSFDDVALQALLDHGAEADVPNVFQITPLMAVAGMSGAGRGNGYGPQQGDLQDRAMKVVDLLLAHGANINARVTDSHTHTAKLVAYVQGRDHEGQTALFAAAEAGWDRVTKDLLDHGADANIRDASGKLALDYAKAPPPVGPGVAPIRADPASRAHTVALLAALVPGSSGVSADIAAAK